jgi:hypothetical protein
MEKAVIKYYINKLVSINNEINFLLNFEKNKSRSFFIEKEKDTICFKSIRFIIK